MDAYLEALKAYQTFNPAGWVAIYRLMPMWAGIVSCVVGLALLLFGGGRLFRLLAGPMGALIGLGWTGVLLAKFGITGMDPRLSSVVAVVLTVLGFIFPPAIVYLGVGIPVGLLGGEIAGPNDYLVGFGPGLILGGVVAAVLHRHVASILASILGGWLLVIGAMAALHQFGGLVTAMASQPWGLIIAAGLFAIAGSVYQIAVRPSPEEAERQHAERQRLKTRMAEQKALEKRWTASRGGK
ncbi:hypothetical protein [Vitiosangium sp. GDMCC 1.1324]|uniref:hypothetical protein n=1 Tax=Vitiosangium sp. (strain GDMCC 1.1324) TaxID=2138576 RepID=UPI000D339D77|nr:hypothetical protein [Vitiosangium sp. GDMCC 1.1324]PTL83746.1 hypothetical protein DAT35_09735 [Vitiosangium sp. GDMCC 1.1324]